MAKIIFKNPIKLYLLLFLYVILISSCSSGKKNPLIGTWKPFDDFSKTSREYITFTSNEEFKTRDYLYLYGNHEINFHLKDTIVLNYSIDSIDVLNGIYYKIFNNGYSRREYALVDFPYLILCHIKPIPKDKSYIHLPSVFVSENIENIKEQTLSVYHNYDFILSDRLNEGDIYIHYSNEMKRSSIKKSNKKIQINTIGLIKINDNFDPRYFAFKKYRAFNKQNDKLIEIPIIYYYELYNIEYEEQIKVLNKYCRSENTKCLIIYPLNFTRSNVGNKNNQEELKTGNIFHIVYKSRETLAKDFYNLEYGSNKDN